MIGTAGSSSNGRTNHFLRRSSSSSVLESSQSMKPSLAVPPHRSQLYLRGSPPRSHGRRETFPWLPRHWTYSRCIVISFSILLFGTMVMTAVMLLSNELRPGLASSLEKQEIKHAIVIDAGSSGSRLHVFQYRLSATGQMKSSPKAGTGGSLAGEASWELPEVLPVSKSLKIRPGLSSFAEHPDKAGASLQPLINFAQEQVPISSRATTPLYLMATAGLRRLDGHTADQILAACLTVLEGSGFNISKGDGVAVISGVWEGLYAWVAANYAAGKIGKAPDETSGIIELGGASAQVTFVVDSGAGVGAEQYNVLTLGGVAYPLFSQSFLNYGQEAAAEGLAHLLQEEKGGGAVGEGSPIVDPCKQRGYNYSLEDPSQQPGPPSANGTLPLALPQLTGGGNFSQCRRAAAQLLAKGHEACGHEGGCAIGSVFVPPLRGSFLATENFVYTAQFLELPPSALLADMATAGEALCAREWPSLAEAHRNMEGAQLAKYCFSAAYSVALLHDALGVGMHDRQVKFSNRVGTVAVDWPLGALVVKLARGSAGKQITTKKVALGGPLADDLYVALFMLAVLMLFGVALWAARKYHKMPPITIYDLEKGRYVTTSSRGR